MHAFARAGLVCLLVSAFQASAENRVCIGGDLDRLSQTQKDSCWETAARVRSSAAKFHAPADWHFYVICTESDWKSYAAFSQRSADEVAILGADTNVKGSETFLRGERLFAANESGLDKIIAHEVASALLKSTDEKLIEKQAALLLSETHKFAA